MDFGYDIVEIKNIDLDVVDKSLFNKVCSLAPDIKSCIACGSCTSTCSVSFFYNKSSFRRAIISIERGDLDSLKECLNSCILCGKCTLVCPRGINTRGAIVLFKDLLKKEEF